MKNFTRSTKLQVLKTNLDQMSLTIFIRSSHMAEQPITKLDQKPQKIIIKRLHNLMGLPVEQPTSVRC